MKGRDYLWCLTNIILDREEELGWMCPGCRSRALEEHCSLCGLPASRWAEGMENAAFDPGRFETLRGGTEAD